MVQSSDKGPLSFELPKFQIEIGFWKGASDLKYNVLKSSEDSFEILGFYNHDTNIVRIRHESLHKGNKEYSGYKNSVVGRLSIVNSISAILYFTRAQHDRNYQLESTIQSVKEWLNESNQDNQGKYPFTFRMCIYFDFKTQIVYYSALFPNVRSGFTIERDELSKLGIKIKSAIPEYSDKYINLTAFTSNNSNLNALVATLRDKLSGGSEDIARFESNSLQDNCGFSCPWFFSTVLSLLLLEQSGTRSLTTHEVFELLGKPPLCEKFNFDLQDCFITSKNVKHIITISEEKIKEMQSEHILLFDLKNYLTPHELQQRMNTMNIDLIKWRLIPNFEQIHFKNLKFLIVGSGTLGCSVARNLIGWGIRNFTFIDHSKVSLNNPIRQCLFTIEDAKNRKNKAQAAVERLRYICPELNAQGIDFEIPILGDSTITPEQFLNLANETRSYILDSDVVMLLTDNKESRWLPTVLTALINRYHHRKRPILCITVGLGFDSFIVVRNTFTETDHSNSGCYFCGDFSINSKSNILDIPVDQQCSVVRMGASYFASSIAVELMMNLSQHPLMWNAPHLSNSSNKSEGNRGENKSLLGNTPKCIRGFLGDFSFCTDPIQRNKHCIACSSELVDQIHKDEVNTLTDIFIDPRKVESISGLDNFKSKMEKSVIESFS